MNIKAIQRVLNGEWLTDEWISRHKWMLLIVAFWAFVYIYMGFFSARQQRHEAELKKELREQEYTLVTLQSKLTNLTRQSSVAEELKKNGSRLKECTQTVKRIK